MENFQLNKKVKGPVDLFACKINYNTVTDAINGQVKPQYNGNIAETFWRTATDNIKRKYGYSYDHQHRLTAAYYQLPRAVTPRRDSYSTSYSYDDNGNILSLKRNGMEDSATTIIEIDDLDYSYDQGNRLLKVKDASNHPAGFNRNGAGTNAQYTYDDYGNLKTDPYKKITNITYNHLHLPVKVTFQGGETMEYTYLADGTKIKKTAKNTQNTTTTTEYREGFQYIDDVLEFFPTSEGYVKYNSNNLIDIYSYVFTYTDHLGNIRLKYTENPQTGELTILEEDHYYPYGLTHQGYQSNHQTIGFDGQVFTLIPVTPQAADSYKYKFNGMEWQDEFDINLYDFGARNYDPALGRWMNMDPLAEAMRRHSPYNFAFNNPVYFIDPDGMFSMPWGMFMENASVDGQGGGGYGSSNNSATSSGSSESGRDGSLNFQNAEDSRIGNPNGNVSIQNGGTDLVYSGDDSGGGDVINPNNPVELDEVVISTTTNQNKVGISDVSWFLSTTTDGIKRNSEYNAEHYRARYGSRTFSAEEITRQTQSQMGRYAKNAKIGGGFVTAAFGIADIYQGYTQDGGQVGQNTKAAMARTGGGVAGAYAGGKIGTIAGGLICGPPCALAGGIIGAAYGGYKGSQQAEKLVN